MGDLVIGLAALLLFSGSGTVLASLVDRRRRRLRERAVWKVAEASADGCMEVSVRKVTADGTELDRNLVASVRDGHPDWDALVAEARALALSRAALLNGKP